MQHFRRMVAVLLIVVVAFLAGCVSKPDDRKVPVYPVEGKVIVLDRLVCNASIVFHPTDHTETIQLYPVGVSGPDGTFRLTTFTANDGAPAGEYVVTVFWPNDVPYDECSCPDPAIHDRLRGQYANPVTSTLRATVGTGRNEIVLHADPGSRGWNLPRLKDSSGAMPR